MNLPTFEQLTARFGIWQIDGQRLDEQTRTLHGPGERAEPLDRSAFEVLRYLLINAGEVCTQDELLAAGWPGRIVTSNSLAKCVSRLRGAMQDDDAQRLRVVHRFGYRLVANVRFLPSATEASAETETAGPARLEQQIPSRDGWRIIRSLGRGATGEVWLAENAVGERRAYKLTETEPGLRSLKREVALHRLLEAHHPLHDSRDPLLDWNLESPPFFVATAFHADGNLAQWCGKDDQLASMTLASRLRLAAAVCESVAALHEADIAHRDLKPENLYPIEDDRGGFSILIGDLGIGLGMLPPGVDETGLALGQLTKLGEGSVQPSATGLYLAPEVLMGNPATAKSDIFALGVLIYQLAVGDLRRALAPGWHLHIDDELLRQDIEIAANLDPVRRTLSARMLAENLASLETRRNELDLHRKAESERRDAEQRIAKMRRRWIMGLAASFALFIAASTTSWLALEAKRLQDAAQQRSLESLAVREFLTEQLLAQANPYEGANRDIRLKDALDVSAGLVDERFGRSPETATAVHLTLAEIYEGWSEYEPALKHQQAGLALMRTSGPETLALAKQERLLCLYARRAGEPGIAAEACRHAERIESMLLGGATPETRVARAKLDFDLGQCAGVIAQLGDVIDGHSQSPLPKPTLADALWFRGLCFADRGRFVESRGDFERLIPLREAIDGPAHPDLAWALMDFAETSIIAGDFDLARPLLTRAQTIFTDRLGEDHVDTQVAHYEWARIAQWSGDAEKALELFSRVFRHWEQSIGETHLWTLYTRAELGWAQAQTGRHDEARESLRRSRELADTVLDGNPASRSFFRETWIRTWLALGDIESAEAELPLMQQDLAQGLDSTHPRNGVAECLAAEIHHLRGRAQQAREALLRCENQLNEALKGLPANNYRRTWAAQVRSRLAEDR